MVDTQQQEKQEKEEQTDRPSSRPGALWKLPPWIRRHRAAVAIGLVAVASATILVAWFFARDLKDQYHQQLQHALRLIKRDAGPAERDEARQIAKQLTEAGYRDPDFPGGVEFIVGMAAFRDAEELDAEGRYLIAAHELKKAERLVLDDSRRPEWAYALGTSLHELEKPAEARPLLEEAIETYPPGRDDATVRLIDIYLDQRNPEVLQKALDLNGELSKSRTQGRQRDAAHLRSARLHLSLGHKDEAKQSLGELSEEARKTEPVILLQSRILMFEAAAEMAEFDRLLAERGQLTEQARRATQEQEFSEADRLNERAERRTEQALLHKRAGESLYRQAIRKLKPLASQPALEQKVAHQAQFLTARCLEALGDMDAALNLFEQLAEQDTDSQDTLAANLWAGDLLRRMGRNEEALNKRYRRVLQSVGRPREFRNRWLSLQELRDRILAAWNLWVQEHAYREAVELSNMMSALIGEFEAQELTAHAYERWAEHVQDRLRRSPWSERPELERQLRRHQRQAGDVYARLADGKKASAEYGEMLRLSAEYYTRGRDLRRALRQWTRYIRTRPEGRLPEAIYRRGRVLMDLDHLDEALDQFQRVIDDYPTSPAAFDAQYTIGQCHLERNEPKRAERAWRNILTSGSLTPEAKQWQLALVSLGRLLFHAAEQSMIRANSTAAELNQADREQLAQRAFADWDESIRRLKEFLKRRSTHPEAVAQSHQARYLLAKALQHSSERPRRRIDTAETETARQELRREVRHLLAQALEEFETLQAQLLELQEREALDPLGQRLLRNCFFEIAHTHFALAEHAAKSPDQDYERAIAAYNNAANKYPRDPQVLLAYLQMTNCYQRLNKRADARSMLEQAKVVLKQMPEDRFRPSSTNMTKQQWKEWIRWAQAGRVPSPAAPGAPVEPN